MPRDTDDLHSTICLIGAGVDSGKALQALIVYVFRLPTLMRRSGRTCAGGDPKVAAAWEWRHL